VPTDQAWFWTNSWQAGEWRASEDLARGAVTTYWSAEEFLATLD